jgi:hypothetical protein
VFAPSTIAQPAEARSPLSKSKTRGSAAKTGDAAININKEKNDDNDLFIGRFLAVAERRVGRRNAGKIGELGGGASTES